MYVQVVRKKPWSLVLTADNLKTHKMCPEAIRKKSCQLQYVPDSLETQEMCIKAVEKGSRNTGRYP